MLHRLVELAALIGQVVSWAETMEFRNGRNKRERFRRDSSTEYPLFGRAPDRLPLPCEAVERGCYDSLWCVRRLNTPRRSPTKARSAISKWPKLLRISEEMRQWSGMLEHEVSSWPRVTSRPMFGLVSFYHNGVIFAALPRTRALSTPDSFIFKFDPMPPALLRRARKDPRISSERQTPDVKWYSFQLDAADDMRDAVWWLNRAYEAAK